MKVSPLNVYNPSFKADLYIGRDNATVARFDMKSKEQNPKIKEYFAQDNWVKEDQMPFFMEGLRDFAGLCAKLPEYIEGVYVYRTRVSKLAAWLDGAKFNDLNAYGLFVKVNEERRTAKSTYRVDPNFSQQGKGLSEEVFSAFQMLLGMGLNDNRRLTDVEQEEAYRQLDERIAYSNKNNNKARAIVAAQEAADKSRPWRDMYMEGTLEFISEEMDKYSTEELCAMSYKELLKNGIIVENPSL